MRKNKIYYFFVVLLYILSLNTIYGQEKNIKNFNLKNDNEIERLYTNLNLRNELDFETFKIGYLGAKNIDQNNPILTIVDFSKPSTAERFFVIDLSKEKLLFKTYVAHGKNSGDNYATKFSNMVNSHQSSPGFYTTDTTYFGGNGYSLKLNGLEKGINDNAMERAIVVHGADYANPQKIPQLGRLGRSFGCPALPSKLAKPIIDTIKNGSVMYIHVPNPEYKKKSNFVKKIS